LEYFWNINNNIINWDSLIKHWFYAFFYNSFF
jgi:hypothetical protein